MTVIAWDGKTLAADKRATDGGGIHRTVTKIQRHGYELLGFTGDWDDCVELAEWYKRGANAADFPQRAREGRASLMVFAAGQVLRYGVGPFPMRIEVKQCAFGSGRDYAEAAMHLGHDAKAAVAVACHFQTDCGNGIDTLTLEDL